MILCDLVKMVRNEVLMYFGEQCIARDKSPLQRWKKNAARFPTLAILAKSYLSIPTTSTPSEHLFSAAGNIVTKKKSKPDLNKVRVMGEQDGGRRRGEREKERRREIVCALVCFQLHSFLLFLLEKKLTVTQIALL